MTKRKLLILTDYCGVYTGFSRNIRELLPYLYKNYSNQWEIVLAAVGMVDGIPDFERYPWKVRGVLPNNQQEINELNKDPEKFRFASYGDYGIEKIVAEEKPDVILGIQDEWGICFLKNKSFFNKIPVIFWSTLDSKPIFKEALDTASKSEFYWTWSEFAAKEMRDKHGLKHVKTQYPCINTDKYFKLLKYKKQEIRKKHNIPENSVIFGFTFRNQLRKLVNKLIEGYALFKKQNPTVKNTFLYTHTSYSEGWNIPDLCKQYGVPIEEVLCTYICKTTKEYFIMPFKGQDLNNPNIKEEKTLITVNVQNGVSEEDLNEIYNTFDFYFHPATSGAAELPCVEAALTELIIATSDYSFGEDIIELNKGSFPIDFSFYTEIGTQFLKSTQSPFSIAKLMKKFYEISPEEKARLGKLSRQWAVENYDSKTNAEKIISFINSIDIEVFKKRHKQENLSANAQAHIPDESDNAKWITSLYNSILGVKPDEKGFNDWMNALKNGVPRQQIESFFREQAAKTATPQQKEVKFEDLLIKNGKKQLLLVCKESAGDILYCSALLESFRQSYPNDEWNIYFACDNQFSELLDVNQYIDKVLPYFPFMESEIQCIGQTERKGPFDSYCFLTTDTQRHLSYLTHDKINIKLD